MALSPNFTNRLMTIASADPTLSLQSVYRLPNSNTAFRINASYGKSRELDQETFENMVLAMTDNKFRLVPDTISDLGVISNYNVISAIVEANLMVKEFKDEEVRAGFRTIAANVFMDNEDDSIWKVVESNGIKQLVQSVNEDFAKLIASRIARKTGQVIAANYMGNVPGNADYVIYYNTERQALSDGYAIIANDELSVMDRHSKEQVAISPANVIEAVAGDTLDGKHNLVAKLKTDFDVTAADDMPVGDAFARYLSYMSTLYQGTDYFNKLVELVKKHRKQMTGSPIKPLNTFTQMEVKKA